VIFTCLKCGFVGDAAPGGILGAFYWMFSDKKKCPSCGLWEMIHEKTIEKMRSFGIAQCPGYNGEMKKRFNDSPDQIKARIVDALQRVREERIAEEPIINFFENNGLRIASIDPSHDADIKKKFVWVSVMDKLTCKKCSSNHGKIKTLEKWSEIGEPRSGACVYEKLCRCVLIPENKISDSDMEIVSQLKKDKKTRIGPFAEEIKAIKEKYGV
jgi:hypothetical protein